MKKKLTKVYVGGTFDLFHEGHVRLLRRAKKIADIVIVALNTDAFVLHYKGKLPVMSLAERMAVVKACRYVDIVDVNEGGADSKPCILRNMPDFILHGDDWKGDALLRQLSISTQFLKTHRIRMVYVRYTKRISTTALKERLKKQLL
ncbi:FAD synthase [Candidatus Gottesmanbacteria bacterium]|nr:FAD synthase [Candidatus Gottesmanbacteria bacterium]